MRVERKENVYNFGKKPRLGGEKKSESARGGNVGGFGEREGS